MKKNLVKVLLVSALALMLTGCGEAKKAYNKGIELAAEGKYEESLSYFKKAVGEKQNQAEYYIGYGTALNRLNRYEEAKVEFGKALKQAGGKISQKESKQLYYGMAVAAYGLGEYASVEEYCENALAIDKPEDMDGDILYTRMLAFCQQESWEQAKKDCEEILKEDDQYYDACLALAEIEFKLGNDDAADKQLDKLLEMKPKGAQNMLVIGRAYYYKKEYDKAKEYLEKAYNEKCMESKYYTGIIYSEEQSYDEAVQSFEVYIKENKDNLNVDVYYQLALIYMEREESDKAQSAIDDGLSYGRSSAFGDLKRLQVILLEKQNRYDEALKQAKEYLKAYPSDAAMKKERDFIKTRIK